MADIAATITTTAAFAQEPTIGSSFSGRYETFGDRDWVKITLTAGVTYKFFASAEGAGANSGDSLLRLFDAAGTQVQAGGVPVQDDDGGVGLNSLLTFRPTSSGTYFVDVATFGNVPGSYSVTVTGQSLTDVFLTDAANTYTGNAGERIIAGKGDDIITLGAATQAFGEQGEDVINGNGLDNFLTGGLGNDTISGGGGGDRIYADGGLDLVFGNDGDDLIFGGIDDDVISGDAGADTLSGEEGVDELLGGAGDDYLKGGSGGDRMDGGDDNDTYIVDDAADIIIAGISQGTQDVVYSTLSYTLTAGAEIETLATTAINGTTVIDLIGNDLSQRINGNMGANYLGGRGGSDLIYGFSGNDRLEGGAGNDNLVGGIGADGFVFRQSQLSSGGVDHVLDFRAEDSIQFDVSSGATGVLAAGAFRSGSVALDANDRFMYDAGSGNLYFDPDGNGSGARTLFAVLDNHFAVTASDILLF